ncbi:hypothetical protein AB0K80_06905 [Streptomyces sp. NPDC052682]|uniref:hypothetical protein n=1 Tax=Streptomyces sp. NPDC052682 TaxID=3154954 RepID=UPI00342B7D96
MSEPYGGDGPGGAGRRRAEAARLRAELRALGRSMGAPASGPETMVERVLGQILAEQVPVPVAEQPGAGERLRAVRRWTRARWRSLTAALCGLLTVLALTPPVRAAVSDWFGFGGVEVRYDPSAVPSPGARVPGCGGRPVSLAQAERRAGFSPLVPGVLGPADAVSVSGLPRGRVLVSLCWRERGHTLRLDEFRARLDVSFIKTVREQPELLPPIEGSPADRVPDPALWFPRAHMLSFPLVGPDGERSTWRTRSAGPTLLWTSPAGDGVVTLRLEGVSSKERAVEIATSLEKPDSGSSGGPR